MIATCHVVDAVEDSVLHRVGVLEFVNQSNGKLATDRRGQLVAPGAVQRIVQPGEQIVKAHFRAFLLF